VSNAPGLQWRFENRTIFSPVAAARKCLRLFRFSLHAMPKGLSLSGRLKSGAFLVTFRPVHKSEDDWTIVWLSTPALKGGVLKISVQSVTTG
jgi:hypothetical protein